MMVGEIPAAGLLARESIDWVGIAASGVARPVITIRYRQALNAASLFPSEQGSASRMENRPAVLPRYPQVSVLNLTLAHLAANDRNGWKTHTPAGRVVSVSTAART